MYSRGIRDKYNYNLNMRTHIFNHTQQQQHTHTHTHTHTPHPIIWMKKKITDLYMRKHTEHQWTNTLHQWFNDEPIRLQVINLYEWSV